MAGVGALVCRVFGAASGVTAAVALAGFYKASSLLNFYLEVQKISTC